ncbi:MAG: hypothetical protein ACJ8EI_06060 [Sphingomicrobium sp.]
MKQWLAVLLLLMSGGPAGAESPQVGDIFGVQPGSLFRGWHLTGLGQGLYQSDYAVFDRGPDYLVAIVSPLVVNAKGGHEVHKIKQVFVVRAKAYEETVDGPDCSFIGFDPAIAFYDPRTKIARGVFATPDQIVEKRWFAERQECQGAGD